MAMQESDNWCEDVAAGAVVLTVNQRLSRHLMQQYQQVRIASGELVWETPPILPLTAWLIRLHSDALASGDTDRTMLPSISALRLWRRCVLEDESTGVLLDPDAAAQGAQKAWSIAQHWRCKATGAAMSVDSAAFARWCKAYETECRQRRLLDDASLVDHIVALLNEKPSAFALPEKCLLAGFLQFTPQQQTLVDALQACGCTVELLERNRVAAVRREVHFDDAQSLLVVAQQVRAELAAGHDRQLGIVVPDLHQRRSEVLRAFDTVFFPGLNPWQIRQVGRPYDLSLGLPLSEQSVVRTALLLLKLLVHGLDSNELSVFLLSAYLPGSERDARQREVLDRRLREDGVRHLSLFGLIARLSDSSLFRKGLQALSALKWPESSGSALWAEKFGQALALFGWPGRSPDSEEFQCIEAWHSCLDDMQVLDDGESLGRVPALTMLQRLCRERLFQLDTPATPVQIMGRLESHGLSFEKLWICGMDAGQWPPAANPTPFISIKQQQEAGVPDASANLQLALAEKEFDLWSNSCDELVVCHAQVRDALELQPASVVEHISTDGEVLGASAAELAIDPVRRSGELLAVEDNAGPALEAGSVVGGGARLLENQAMCPFKAFATHRLAIKPLEEAEIGLDPREHGTLLHLAMQYFWEKVRTHAALVSMDDAALSSQVDDAIDAALDEYKVEKQLQPLQRRHLQNLVYQWITVAEKPRTPFEVIGLEEKCEIEIGGIGMRLQVDRTDKLESGETLVLDYKTGQGSKVSSWDSERIENPQLPLYASLDEDIEGVAFAQVFPHKHRFIGMVSNEGMLPGVSSASKQIDNWQDLRSHWHAALENVAGEIRSGLATVTPAKGACQYCDLPGLCRVDVNQAIEEQTTDNTDGSNS